jgi:trigger factor
MASTYKKLPHSEVELKFTLDPVKLEVAREAAFDKIASQVKVPGFRPGKAPKKLLAEQVNPVAAMQQGLDEVLNEAFQEALREHDIVPVANPDVDISSTDITKPIEVIAKVQVRPEAKVGAWQKIKIEREKAEVDDKKVDETMQTIFERSTKQGEEGASASEGAGLMGVDGQPLTKSEPEMNDDWAKKLGAKDVEDLRSQVRVDLEAHANYDAETAWQDKVLEKIIDMTEVDLPQAFIDDEIGRMRSQFEQQLQALQVTMEQYAEQSGKTVAEMEEQWKPQAIKQATLEVALAEIANQEKIEITDKEVDDELAKADAKIRAQSADPRQRQYLAYSLWRQNVLRKILDTVSKNADEKIAAKK